MYIGLIVVCIAYCYCEVTEIYDTDNVTSCDENNTCFYDVEFGDNITDLYNTTLYDDENTTDSNTIDNTKFVKTFLNQNYDAEFCTCDLQVDFCDINCCCDSDCSRDKKLIFNKCLSHNVDNSEYCYNNQIIFRNNTPYRWHEQNGFFCIIKNNLPASYIVQNSKTIKSLKKAQTLISDRKTWMKIPSQKLIQFVNKSLQFGDQMWIGHNLKIQKFTLPNNFITSGCLGVQNIKYLQNYKSDCVHTNIDEDISTLNALTYFKNITVLSNNILKDLRECPRNVCVPINAFLCDNSQICEPFHLNSTKSNVTCTIKLYANEKHCLNLVQSVKYNVYHNGTKGIVDVHLHIHLNNLTYFMSDDHAFRQYFEVNFIWYNATLNYTSHRSGNPGYILGKPVLVAELNETVSNTTYKYLHMSVNYFDVTKNLLSLPKNVQGDCKLSNQTYLPVNFGFNFLSKCSVRYEFKIVDLNATDICKSIQTKILNYWPVNVTDRLFVGAFGNADSKIFDDWVEILYGENVHDILDSVAGKLEENNVLTCSRLVHGANLNILYSFVDFNHLFHQAKILNVFLTFERIDSVSLHLSYNKKVDRLYVETDVFTEVMFHDVTTAKIRKYVKPPTFKIKLPHDFFYPFMSNGQIVKCDLLYVCFVCALLIFVTF